MPKGLEKQLRKQGKRCVGNGRETGDLRLLRRLVGEGWCRKMMEVYNVKNRTKEREESKCPHVFSTEVGWSNL